MAVWNSSSPAETVRLAASTPLRAYADPLALDSGNGLITSVFDGLTRLDRDGAVKPALAESWDVTSDTTWVFRLRPGVVFSDGSPFNADTVVDYMEFMTAPEASAYPIAVDAVTILGARKLDPLTVEITTKQADPILDRKLNRLKIFPVETLNEMGRAAFSRQPVGTGAYKVLEWDRGGSSGVVLVGAQNSWRPPVQINRVEFIVLPDASRRVQSLMAGAVDIANNIDPDMIPVIENAGFWVQLNPGPMILAMAFHNCGVSQSSPMADRRVRLALNMAVDKDRIVSQLLGGTTEAAHQGGTPDAFGYNSDIESYPFDPDGARALLAEAGYGDGLNIVVALFTGQFPADTLIFQQMAQDWSSIGVNAELRRLAMPEFIRRGTVADWEGIDAFSAAWSHYQLGEVSWSLKRFAGDHAGPYFCAPDLLEDIAVSDQEMDEQVREEMLKDLMARLHEKVPHLPLVRYTGINAISPRVLDFKSIPNGILFGEMHVKPE